MLRVLHFIMIWFYIFIVGLYTSCAMAQHKNVLMVIADDYRPNMGVYEDANEPFFTSPRMVTPNLDALASKSLILTRAYTMYAQCGPSRNAFLTGRRPDTTRCYNNEHVFRDRGPNNQTSPIITIPQFFMENGYISIGAGKVFHGGFDDAPFSFTETHQSKDNDDDSISWRAFSPAELEGARLRDTAEAGYVIDKLQELAPDALLGIQPFFLAFGLHKPHLPWDFPEEFLDYYPEEQIQMPLNPYIPSDLPEQAWVDFSELRTYSDCSAEGSGIEDIGVQNVTYPDSKVKELRRAYYAAVSYADQQIGRVIQQLELLGLADNTVIMFLGDHGWQLGEHSEWTKETNFEIAHRVPLMLHVPGVIDSSAESDRLVELMDVFPTLVEAAGFDPMSKCPSYSRNISLCREGMSLLNLVDNPGEWKDAIFYQQARDFNNDYPHNVDIMGYSVMTEQYRYGEWVSLNNFEQEDQSPNWSDSQDFGELYDLVNDPMENVNLIFKEDYQDAIAELKVLLHEGWLQHN